MKRSDQNTFPYNWNLKDTVFTKDKGKVFSCFACGGGSTMGYKLAGFDVLGCNEIDSKMMDVYRLNHIPKYSYLEPIQTFKARKDLPEEFYNLDILDGSWPCSSFSSGGNRGKDWGKEKKFKEGQVKQVLDTLCYDFIDLAAELRPKVVFGENVEGLLQSNAIEYMRGIYRSFDQAGYYLQHWLFDCSNMGLPQERKRVVFIALRKDLATKFLIQKDFFTVAPQIDLNFRFKTVNFSKIQQFDVERKPIINSYLKYWNKANYRGVYDERSTGGKKFGFFRKAMKNKPLATIMSGNVIAIEEKPEHLTTKELCLCQSFPTDYDFGNEEPQYLIGMSVPPIMIALIATEIHKQWLSKL